MVAGAGFEAVALGRSRSSMLGKSVCSSVQLGVVWIKKVSPNYPFEALCKRLTKSGGYSTRTSLFG